MWIVKIVLLLIDLVHLRRKSNQKTIHHEFLLIQHSPAGGSDSKICARLLLDTLIKIQFKRNPHHKHFSRLFYLTLTIVFCTDHSHGKQSFGPRICNRCPVELSYSKNGSKDKCWSMFFQPAYPTKIFPSPVFCT